jgi:hypothetical protein
VRRILLLLLLAALALGAWATRDRWLSRDTPAATSIETAEWEPLTPEGAERARRAIESLAADGSRTRAAEVRAGDLASFIFNELARQLPPSAENIAAAVVGDRLYIRASVKPSDLGDTGALGPLAAMLGEREQMMFGGHFRVIRTGLAEFRVGEIKVRELRIPSPLIPKIIAQIARGARPEGVSPDGLPLEIPAYIGEVAVDGRQIVLRRSAQ